MQITETAKPAHRDGGGLRNFEQLAGQLETSNSPSRSTSQVPVAKTGTCRECKSNYRSCRASREFCSTACRQSFNNRRMTRGAAIYSLAMQWRADRKDKRAFSLLCRLLT